MAFRTDFAPYLVRLSMSDFLKLYFYDTGLAANLLGILVDLDREFTRRREDHRTRVLGAALWMRRTGEQAVVEGDQKGSRFAGTGLGLTGDILAGQGDRQAHRLDRGTTQKTRFIQALKQAGVQVEAFEDYVGKGFVRHCVS